MTAIEQLFRLEIEFHRRLRTTYNEPGIHTSWALLLNYEALMRAAEGATFEDVSRTMEKLLLAGDERDVLSARDSVTRLLRVRTCVEIGPQDTQF
jgi:hypothetical protein